MEPWQALDGTVGKDRPEHLRKLRRLRDPARPVERCGVHLSLAGFQRGEIGLCAVFLCLAGLESVPHRFAALQGVAGSIQQQLAAQSQALGAAQRAIGETVARQLAGQRAALSVSMIWCGVTDCHTSSRTMAPAVPSWLAGAGSLTQARSWCSNPSFTAGRVAMVQFPNNGLDGDVAC